MIYLSFQVNFCVQPILDLTVYSGDAAPTAVYLINLSFLFEAADFFYFDLMF